MARALLRRGPTRLAARRQARHVLGGLVGAAAALAFAADARLTTTGIPGRAFPSGSSWTGGNHANPPALWLELDGTPTPVQIQDAAAHDRVVVLNAWETGALRKLKQLNPRVTVLVYKNISATRSDTTHALEASGVRYREARPEWFARSPVDGRRLEWPDFPHNYQMTVWSTAYQRAWADAVAQEVLHEGWDGVFADDAVSRLHAHVSAPMVGCSSDEEMRTAVAGLVAVAGRALVAEGRILVPNVAEASAHDGWWARLTGFGGGFEEYLAHVGPDPRSGFVTDEPGSDWSRQADLLSYTSFPLVHTDAVDSDDVSFRYGLATFWVAGGGRGAFSVTAPGVHGPVRRRAEQLWDLGDPVQPARDVGGAYVRNFSRGFAAVNPGSGAVRVVVPPGAVDARGAPAGSVDLPPHHGVVYRIG